MILSGGNLSGAWRGGGASFSPAELSGITAWLRPDTGVYQDSAGATPITADGQAVGGMGDVRTPAVIIATQSGSGRPLWKENVANGQPVLRFDGIDDWLNLSDLFSGLVAAEVFAVVRNVMDGSSGGLWDFGSSTETTHFAYIDGLIYDDFGTDTRKATADPASALTSWRIYSVVSTASEWTSYLDGAQLYTAATNTVGWTTTPRLGAGSSGGTNFPLACDLAEFLLFSRKLSLYERALVLYYLGARYGVSVL